MRRLTFFPCSRNAEMDNGQCKIGLKLPANIPLLVFDFTINVCGHHVWYLGGLALTGSNLGLSNLFVPEASCW